MAADPSLTPRQVKALSYWGVIEASRASSVSQSALWDAIHAEAASRGETRLGFNAADLAKIMGFANSIRRTATDIAGASTDTPLTDIRIGSAPWQRSLAEQATIPQWQARFIHTTAAEAPSVDPGAADGAPGGDTPAEPKRATRARGGRPEYGQTEPRPAEDAPTPAPASGNG